MKNNCIEASVIEERFRNELYARLKDYSAEDFLAVRNYADGGTIVYRKKFPSVARLVSTFNSLSAFVKDIYVSAEYRRRGVGRSIYESFERAMFDSGIFIIEVTPVGVGEGFWEDVGFRKSGARSVKLIGRF